MWAKAITIACLSVAISITIPHFAITPLTVAVAISINIPHFAIAQL